MVVLIPLASLDNNYLTKYIQSDTFLVLFRLLSLSLSFVLLLEVVLLLLLWVWET